MNEHEEEKLLEWKKHIDNISIQETALNQAILTGFQNAKQEEKKKRKSKKWVLIAAMAAVILLSFITSVRVSPAFASYIANIPGMEKIVDLIRDDKGRIAAIENDYYEALGISEKKNGVEVIIDGAIADEQGIVLFYTIQTEEKRQSVNIDQFEIRSGEGKELDLKNSSYSPEMNEDEFVHSFHGVMEYFFQTPLDTSEFILALEVNGETFNLPFTLKKEKKENKIYALNETVTVEGQEITFQEVTITPLRAEIHVQMNPDNTKKILSFDEMRLVNEQGESWSKIKNGVTGTGISDNEMTLYLQSNYFKEPKELYLVLGKIQAIDKEESVVMVDTEKEVILKQPERNLFPEVVREGDFLVFKYDEAFPYAFFDQSYDANGREIHSGGSYLTTPGDGRMNEFGYEIEHLLEYKSPISLELSFFPEWIIGDEKIKIK